MIEASLLVTYAAIVGHLGGSFLNRQRFMEERPRLGLAVWFAAVLSFMLSNAFAAALMALDSATIRGAATDLVGGCLEAWHQHKADTPLIAVAGSIFLLVSVLWLLVQALLVIVHTSTARRRHRTMLDLIGTADHRIGATVLEHGSINAYCLPGRGGRVVVTSGALDVMSADELSAVLAHERAHLAGRHYLMMGTVQWLLATLPFLPLARKAEAAVSFLIERAADEVASQRHGRAAVASALLIVNRTSVPRAALGVSGGSARRRVTLLARPTTTRNRLRDVLTADALALLLVALPLALAVGPTVGLDWTSHCLVAPVA